jgi:hypothetical protein
MFPTVLQEQAIKIPSHQPNCYKYIYVFKYEMKNMAGHDVLNGHAAIRNLESSAEHQSLKDDAVFEGAIPHQLHIAAMS